MNQIGVQTTTFTKEYMQQQILNDRYTIEQKLGEGGMAIVYQGYDRRLNRRVAIKILHSQYGGDPEFLNRFHHEAQAAAIFNHPNVVSVYDVGQDGATHYIVMHYVEGVNLKTLINREAPLAIADAVQIAEAVAHGLEAAHRVGLIHRDIKPQNIMVEPDGHVRITDFGIAKSHLSTAKTQTGMTFGTADYISPEQAQGLPATPRSDIYSLGVTLYEMLTARLPFTGDSPITVAMQHVSTPPRPPHQINPNIPAGLETLVLQAMAKDLSQRPTSAQEFATLLRSYRSLAEQPTVVTSSAPPPMGIPPGNVPVQPRPVHYQPGSASSSTTGRSTLPPPLPMAKSPQSQGIGCGIFIVGMVILLGVLGLVLLFSSGFFESLVPDVVDRTTQPVIDTPTATVEQETPTPTVSPTPSPTSVPLVSVPDVVRMSETQARQVLLDARLRPVYSESRYHTSIPEGAVIEQLVPAFKEIREGDPVTYVLSLGRKVRIVEVPTLVSRRSESAQAEARELGLLVEVEEQPSQSVSAGFVIRQDPVGGMRVEEGETVRLVVSMGDKVQMPDVIGMSEQDAEAVINSTDGIYVSYKDYQGFDKLGDLYFQVLPGVVVSTAPDRNIWVNRGTGVTLGIRAYD